MSETNYIDANAELDKVSGGENTGNECSAFRCSNPKCPEHFKQYVACGMYCRKCGWPMERFIIEE